jgi:AcrR family transcriptional regulator
MPTPDRTSLDAIVAAAAELLESEGLPGLTMNAVAQRVGVRPPSLYKRVEGRDRLIQLVAEGALAELAVRLSAETSAVGMMNLFRDFGRERPAAFQLVMGPGAGTPAAHPEFGAAATAPILRVTAQLAGEEHALEAARTLTAWVVGFLSMELNGRFMLEGDVQQAWEFGLRTVVRAISSAPAAPAASPATG